MEEAITATGLSETALLEGCNEGEIKWDLRGPRGSRRIEPKSALKFAAKF